MVLPSEALLDVFAYVGPISLVSASLACERFNALIRENPGALAILRKTRTALAFDVLADVLWCLDGTMRHVAWQSSKLFSKAVHWGRLVRDDDPNASISKFLAKFIHG